MGPTSKENGANTNRIAELLQTKPQANAVHTSAVQAEAAAAAKEQR